MRVTNKHIEHCRGSVSLLNKRGHWQEHTLPLFERNNDSGEPLHHDALRMCLHVAFPPTVTSDLRVLLVDVTSCNPEERCVLVPCPLTKCVTIHRGAAYRLGVFIGSSVIGMKAADGCGTRDEVSHHLNRTLKYFLRLVGPDRDAPTASLGVADSVLPLLIFSRDVLGLRDVRSALSFESVVAAWRDTTAEEKSPHIERAREILQLAKKRRRE